VHDDGLVTLRPVVEADLPLFLADQLEPESARMAAFASRGEEEFFAHWRRLLADDAVLIRTIECDGEVVGHVESFVHGGVREVGYWITKAYWGRGIASRAVAAFVGTHDRSRPLTALAAAHNKGSQRVLEKCGFVRTGIELLPLPDGVRVEMLLYELASVAPVSAPQPKKGGFPGEP
jgi:RimJ/RimL family protein N-acetyltransferase